MSSRHSNTSSPSEPSHSPQDPDQSGSKDDAKADGTARKRRKVTRSRAGCLTCRKRRKLCDMAKPDCGACERLRMVRVMCKPLGHPSLTPGMCVACRAKPRRGRASIAPTPASVDISVDVVPGAASAIGPHFDNSAPKPVQARLISRLLVERYQPLISGSSATTSAASDRTVCR